MSLLVAACLFLSLFFPSSASAASTQNFYFKDAKFDYYLEKAADGAGNLHVKETLTAVFPKTNQNHGIERAIPYTNQAGKNTTVPNEKSLNLTVTRNGSPENISNIKKENGYYLARIGDANRYVHGQQTYVLEYDFQNVITPPQELYWDTNGTGWNQRFETLTASLHLPKNLIPTLKPDAWCYVGRAGESGQDRCSIEKTADGFTFTTNHLLAHENLTFVTEFAPNTFVIILQQNYFLVFLAAAIIILSLILLVFLYSRWVKFGRENYRYYKNLFVAPEYSAPKNLSVAEAGELSLESTRTSYVATLLDLAIKQHIQLIKDDSAKKKDSWKVKILNLDQLPEPSLCVLKILKGTTALSAGDEFKIEKHTATSTLENLSRDYKNSARNSLVKKGLIKTSAIPKIIFPIIIAAFILAPILIGLSAGSIKNSGLLNGYLVGESFLLPAIIIILVTTFALACFIGAKLVKYKRYTKSGLDQSNYLRGLKLYLKMAEKDRLQFLQSVKGVDTSNRGIVKLYEKLLPYACIFGLENSWMSTLNHYYELDDATNPNWYHSSDGLITLAAFSSVNHSLNSAITSSISYSSSSSGGGGGGFSGGGGGGGGGGGW